MYLIIIYMMKFKYSLLIYNKARGYVDFKWHISMWLVKANLYCM